MKVIRWFTCFNKAKSNLPNFVHTWTHSPFIPIIIHGYLMLYYSVQWSVKQRFYHQLLHKASFYAPVCFVYLFYPLSVSYNIIKTQTAYHISQNDKPIYISVTQQPIILLTIYSCLLFCNINVYMINIYWYTIRWLCLYNIVAPWCCLQ